MDKIVLGDKIGLREEVIKKACSLSMKAHEKSPGKPYIHDKSQSSNHSIFAFPGLWALGDWCSNHNLFGDSEVDSKNFPSLRSVGTDEVALANAAFSARFSLLLLKTSLSNEVQKAISEGKQIVFTGHSSGGPAAILAAIWCLETHFITPTARTKPFCITFGCPLIGDRIFSHALRREDWSQFFIHFVTRHDLVPRLMLTPLPSIHQPLQTFFDFVSPKSNRFKNEALAFTSDSLNLFAAVMKSACSVASRAACNLMGSTNLLVETLSSFVHLSPYRPFGTFVFCADNGKLILVENPDAVLQMLFFSLQVASEAELPEVVKKSFKDHLHYESVMKGSLEMQQDVVDFSDLTELPLTSDSSGDIEVHVLNEALDDLGLSAQARLCLRAAGEQEKQREKNKERIEGNKGIIRERLSEIVEYQTKCDARKLGYYDSFKLQRTIDDFNTNVKRHELAGIMDEIIDLLKRHELPDGFEAEEDWVRLGTEYRRLVEPLDIANYYRHLKNEDTGPYMRRARPKRYRFTQRWLEHAQRKGEGECSESCFWAEVEELKNEPVENLTNVMQRIRILEEKTKEWFDSGLLCKHVFFDQTTFSKWWKSLPPIYRQQSCISRYFTT